MPDMLEYQFQVKIKKGKSKEIVIKTERMPYWPAHDLRDELNKGGVHYQIIEINPKCNNRTGHLQVDYFRVGL